ncbi:MAG TPA: type II toxin-antitoxin system VapC family toxin [Nitrososphaerales archaeon]|nr:type II toxin-antitoxin system VapC family toxin [Nitrososphaerales archaeon]
MSRLLVDANIFLELELSQSKARDCKAMLSQIASGKLKAMTTDFILDSIAVVMEDKGSPPADIRRFFASLLLYKGLAVHNLDLKGRVTATGEMERYGLGFDDSTSVAVMKLLKLKEIASFDHHFDRVEGIKRVEPKTVTQVGRGKREGSA